MNEIEMTTSKIILSDFHKKGILDFIIMVSSVIK